MLPDPCGKCGQRGLHHEWETNPDLDGNEEITLVCRKCFYCGKIDYYLDRHRTRFHVGPPSMLRVWNGRTTQRQCTTCNGYRPAVVFRIDPTSPDGLAAVCPACAEEAA